MSIVEELASRIVSIVPAYGSSCNGSFSIEYKYINTLEEAADYAGISVK